MKVATVRLDNGNIAFLIECEHAIDSMRNWFCNQTGRNAFYRCVERASRAELPSAIT